MKDINKLIVELKNGRTSAFDEIYKMTYKSIFFVAFSVLKNKEESEDIVHDTFIKFYENINNMIENKNPYNWLYTVAKNLAINNVKKNNKTTQLDFAENITSEKNEIFDIVSYNNILEIAMKILSEQEQEVLYLCLLEGYKRREVSLILNKPIPTITWVYNNALAKLKNVLKEGK